MALEEKTEAPTERRREEARKKGQTARSIELSSGVAMLATLMTLKFTGARTLESLRDLCQTSLTVWPRQDLTAQVAFEICSQAALKGLTVLAPVLLVAMLAAIVITAAQVGLVISGEALAPQLNRLDPMKGIMRLCSKRSVVELARSILKVVLVGYVIWMTFRDEAPRLALLVRADWTGMVSEMGRVAWTLIVRACCTILAIAALDFAFQRRQHEQDLKMTRQEVKEDMKRSEGDPAVRSRIRQIMRDMARKRMMAAVPTADVVVTNPTHLAVALKYDPETMAAPIVVAKGERLVAERIKQLARQHRVPVIENVPLARSLYKSVNVGGAVPLELYQAVAEVLAAVYRMKGRTV